MKKINLLLMSFFIMTTFQQGNLFGQGAYVSVNGGYGFAWNAQDLGELEFYKEASTANSTTLERVPVSLGQGFNFGGAFGYMFNDNIGAQIDVSYLIGKEHSVSGTWPDARYEYKLSSQMWRFTPAIIITPGFDRFNPYGKIGLSVGVGHVIEDMEIIDDMDVIKGKARLDGGVSFGLNTAFGVDYILNENFTLFSQVTLYSMTYAPEKGELTEISLNGADILHQLTTNEKEIEYVDKYTYSHTSPEPDSAPSKELKHNLPFSSLGVNIGLRFRF